MQLDSRQTDDAVKAEICNSMAHRRQGIFRNEYASRVWKEIADNETEFSNWSMFSQSDFLRGIRLFCFLNWHAVTL